MLHALAHAARVRAEQLRSPWPWPAWPWPAWPLARSSMCGWAHLLLRRRRRRWVQEQLQAYPQAPLHHRREACVCRMGTAQMRVECMAFVREYSEVCVRGHRRGLADACCRTVEPPRFGICGRWNVHFRKQSVWNTCPHGSIVGGCRRWHTCTMRSQSSLIMFLSFCMPWRRN